MSIEGITSYPNQATNGFSGGSHVQNNPRIAFGEAQDVFTSNATAQRTSTASGHLNKQTVQFGGLGSGAKTVFNYLKEPNNRPILKGLFYQYGVPALVGSTMLLGPVGWLLAVPGIPIAMLSAWRGEHLVEKAVQAAEKANKGLKGDPLARLSKMGRIFEEPDKIFTPGKENGKEFIKEFNKTLKEVMNSDKKSAAYKMRKMVFVSPKSKTAQWIRAFIELKAKHIEKSGWIGKGGRWILSKLRVGILKPVILAVSLALNAVYLLFHQKAFRDIITKNLKKTVPA